MTALRQGLVFFKNYQWLPRMQGQSWRYKGGMMVPDRPIVSVNLNPLRLAPSWCLNDLHAALPVSLDWLAALGVQGVRVDLNWAALEPLPGRWNHDLLRWYALLFDTLRTHHLKVFALLYHPPAWALQHLKSNPQNFVTAWGHYCQTLAPVLGHIDLLQVWNEPNNYLALLKQDAVLFETVRIGRWHWPLRPSYELLAALFAKAHEAWQGQARLVYNVLTHPNVPQWFLDGWWNWERFSEQFLERAGHLVDVVALDHYPETWAPKLGPLDWACLDRVLERVARPDSVWYGKQVVIGETGYTSAANFSWVGPSARWGHFFSTERDETSMARWYQQALPHLLDRLVLRVPEGAKPWLNLYELLDPPPQPERHPVLRLEDHFGLVRRDGTVKPAFEVVQSLLRPAWQERHVGRSEYQDPTRSFNPDPLP
jgi:hypothetical protein